MSAWENTGVFLRIPPDQGQQGNHYAFLSAQYYDHLGLLKKNLKISGAEWDFEQAARRYESVGHKKYQVAVELHIARLHMEQENLDTAFTKAFSALRLAIEIQDSLETGCAYDTLAEIMIKRGEIEKALIFSDRALETWEETDNKTLWVEALETRMIICFKLGKIKATLDSYHKARHLALHSSLRIRDRITKTFEDLITDALKTDLLIQSKEYRGILSFNLKHSSEFSTKDIRAVYMENNDLKGFGLKKGDIAIVRECEDFNEGDVIALRDDTDGAVFIGRAYTYFDMIELKYTDYVLGAFVRDECTVLGRVISGRDCENEMKEFALLPPGNSSIH